MTDGALDVQRDGLDLPKNSSARCQKIQGDNTKTLVGTDDDMLRITHSFIRSVYQCASGQIECDGVREELVQVGVPVGTGWKTLVLRVAEWSPARLPKAQPRSVS